MLHRKVTTLFMVASCVGLAWAAPDGLRSSGFGAGGPVVGESESSVNPTFINARIERFADGTVGVWGVESIAEHNHNLSEIRFDPNARPWKSNANPDLILNTADWENLVLSDGEQGEFIMNAHSLNTSDEGLLLAIRFPTPLDAGKGLHSGSAQNPDDPEETGLFCQVGRRQGSWVCRNRLCPLVCVLQLRFYPDGVIVYDCKCTF